MRSVSFRQVDLPNIGAPREPRPELSPTIYASRLARVRQRMTECDLDALVIYGDPEHFANLHYLTHFHPRFEEALLIILPSGDPILLVGNEGMGFSGVARIPVNRVLYQPFSLPGQPRNQVRPLAGLLLDCGLKSCRRVGSVGWKVFSTAEFDELENALELPEFIATSLRKAVGASGRIISATAMFIDPETGLRSISEPEQLADFEWLATWNSQSVLDGIRSLHPGMTESDVFSHMSYRGYPFCCQPVCIAGQRRVPFGADAGLDRQFHPKLCRTLGNDGRIKAALDLTCEDASDVLHHGVRLRRQSQPHRRDGPRQQAGAQKGGTR